MKCPKHDTYQEACQYCRQARAEVVAQGDVDLVPALTAAIDAVPEKQTPDPPLEFKRPEVEGD